MLAFTPGGLTDVQSGETSQSNAFKVTFEDRDSTCDQLLASPNGQLRILNLTTSYVNSQQLRSSH